MNSKLSCLLISIIVLSMTMYGCRKNTVDMEPIINVTSEATTEPMDGINHFQSTIDTTIGDIGEKVKEWQEIISNDTPSIGFEQKEIDTKPGSVDVQITTEPSENLEIENNNIYENTYRTPDDEL